MIELSVHLITFNNEKHIEEALQSILNQKVDFNFEIVVGDDCSTDNTFNIVKNYSLNHPDLFRIHSNSSQLGILANFKATLDRCKGHYIFDIAGDDLLKQVDSLQKMVNELKADPRLGFVDSGYDKFYEKENKTQYFSNKKILNASKEHYKNQLLLGQFTPVGICFNRKLLYQWVDFDTYLNMNLTIDDYPILVDLISNTNFARITESLHVYRVHGYSFSHQKSFETHLFQKNQMKDLFHYFSDKYNFSKNIAEAYMDRYHRDILFLAGYFEKKELGQEMYQKIRPKSLKDRIHYWASQYTFFRKLISMF